MNSRLLRWSSAAVLTTLAIVGGSLPSAQAAESPVLLGTASGFAVLAGSAVTNTGPTTVNGDLGLSPGTAITGFPPGTVNGAVHATDAVAAQAQADLVTAYNDAAGRTPSANVTADLGGQTLVPGVYAGATLSLTGTLTLDGQGDAAAVFVFQSSSTLITAAASRVVLVNGASPCNVFWQVTSSATLGTASSLVGSVIALTSVTATTGATVAGRLLARNGAVTLDTNTVTATGCAAAVVVPTPTASASASPSPSASSTASASATPTASITPGPASPPPVLPSEVPVVVPVPVLGPQAAPGVTPSPGVDLTAGETPQLPRTGAPIDGVATAGALSVLLGLALLAASYRPATRGRHVRRRLG